MKTTNEIMTAESVINSISGFDMQNYIEGNRDVTEKYLYHCAKEGAHPEFGYNALTMSGIAGRNP